MTRIVVVGAYPPSLLNFRGALLRALRKVGHVHCISAPACPQVSGQLAEWGISHSSIPIQRNGLNPTKDIQTLLALRKVMKRTEPNVVMAYTVKPVVWTGIALRLLSRSHGTTRYVPLITGLGYAFESRTGVRQILRRIVVALYRAALARANIVLFQNQDNRDAFVQMGIVAYAKTAIVDGSGVDIRHFAKRALPVVGREPGLTFLLIARLLGEKGIREYAAAAESVKADFPRARFLLLGPEDSSPDAISVPERTQWNAVEYLGSAEDVRPYINRCHVYVLPSYHEGMPRTVLEAMSIGRPILTTNTSGCRETVIDGQNGWLVPKADADALAHRMRWFLKNSDQLEKMGQCSRKIAQNRFEVELINRKMLRHLVPTTTATYTARGNAASHPTSTIT